MSDRMESGFRLRSTPDLIVYMSGRIPAGEGRVSVDYYDRRSTQQERKKTSSPRIHPSVQLRSPVPPGNCFTKERRHMNIYEEAEVVNGPPGFMQ